jgi:hypothetical protein
VAAVAVNVLHNIIQRTLLQLHNLAANPSRDVGTSNAEILNLVLVDANNNNDSAKEAVEAETDKANVAKRPMRPMSLMPSKIPMIKVTTRSLQAMMMLIHQKTLELVMLMFTI